ncbi:hypothetical protein GCM10009780_07950 [Actinomadura alba]
MMSQRRASLRCRAGLQEEEFAEFAAGGHRKPAAGAPATGAPLIQAAAVADLANRLHGILRPCPLTPGSGKVGSPVATASTESLAEFTAGFPDGTQSDRGAAD